MENNLVTKSNKLIEARYNLSLNEQKIILYAVSKLDKNKMEFDTVEFDIKEFTELIETKGKRYDEFRGIVRELRKKEIIINTDDKELITGWLSSIRIYKNTGKVTLKFDDALIPYLIELKDRFTRYKLKNILYLGSKYSIRIFELLKQYEQIGKRSFDLEDFRNLLMIEKKQYSRMYDFERFVLSPAVEEINYYTDIKISYEKIKEGKKIKGFLFKIKPKNTQDKVYIEYLNENYNIQDMKKKMGIDKENLNTKQVMDLYELAVQKTQDLDIDIFEYIRLNYLNMLGKGTVRNKFAYLKKALEEDYAKAAAQLSVFNAFGEVAVTSN